METNKWIEEAKKNVENHGLPAADYSALKYQSVTGAINTFVDYAMTKGSQMRTVEKWDGSKIKVGAMTVEETKTLLVWILARHKHNAFAEIERKLSDLETYEVLDIVTEYWHDGKKYRELTDDTEKIRILSVALIITNDLKESYKEEIVTLSKKASMTIEEKERLDKESLTKYWTLP